MIVSASWVWKEFCALVGDWGMERTGDEGEACRSLGGKDVVLSAMISLSKLGMGDAEPIALDGSLDAGLCACSMVCKGVRPVCSKPDEVFLAEAPDSMELRLDVLLCGNALCPEIPPTDRFLASNASGGNIEIVFGRSAGGRMICEAPLRYDRWKLLISFPGDGGLNAGAAWKNCGGACAEGEGNNGTGGMSSSARPSALKNCDFFDLVLTVESGGDG
jgi:hypothetical protein